MKPLKICTAFLACSFLLFSCSDDEDDVISPFKQDASIKLVANKTQIRPFEDIKVSIDVDKELLSESYDSIRWIANGTAYYGNWVGNPAFSQDDWRDRRITDYRIRGEYKVYALGYKDGKVASKDSVSYEMRGANDDFIVIRWGESTKNRYFHYTIGLTPVVYQKTDWGSDLFGGVSLDLSHIVEDGFEYASLRFTPWAVEGNGLKNATESTIPNINDFDWTAAQDVREQYPLFELQYQQEYDFHHNYFSELYGAPKFIYEGSDITQTTLWNAYNERFKYQPQDGYYPEQIWETPMSYICMLRGNNSHGGKNLKGIIWMIAEPKE